jgi:hypothetical protein
MERMMTKELVHSPALPDPIELQRWEDDGGAAAADPRPRKYRPPHAHHSSTERYRRYASSEMVTAA